MAYNNKNLGRNGGFSQMYVHGYFSDDDDLASIITAGYFNGSSLTQGFCLYPFHG